MIKKYLITCVIIPFSFCSLSQSFEHFADSIRELYGMPELNYAIVKSDSVLEINALGNRKVGKVSKANLNDKFRIGSNTKTVTGYLAAVCVKKGLIQWETKFFDLYPELKANSNAAYYDFTLRDFPCLQANLIRWTYTNDEPLQTEITGDAKQQQYEFVKWMLQQKPIEEKKAYYFSNPSYVIVSLMLEKVTHKDYKDLVDELGTELDIDFQFGQPNFKDTNQTWGHDSFGVPENPSDNYKLNWLNSAGNITVSLPDYVKFIQLQLKGLRGYSTVLTEEEFNTLHYGLPVFAYGWKWFVDEENGQKYSYHIGNPGTFLTEVYICKELDISYLFFTNIQSEDAEEGLGVLYDELKKRYGK
jgi:CubicO group peptidase (beta-lactamase class C family)